MEFENLNNENVTKTPSKTKVLSVPIQLGNVTVYFKADPEENFDLITTLDDVLSLDKKKPGLLRTVKPPLYSVFQGTNDKTLEPYVAVGDKVKYRKQIYAPDECDINTEFEVISVELVSLGSMSVFSARLNNGEHSILTNFLKKV